MLVAACQHDTAHTSGAFYDWDGRKVHCAINLDSEAHNDLASVEAGLDRARDMGEVLELYAHDPGHTVAWDQVEAVLAAASARGLPFFTYADFAAGVPASGGVVLSFDDASITDWLAGGELFARYGARLTFFITYFDQLGPDLIAGLHELAREGHAIEPHSAHHLRAPAYVEDHGLAAYLVNEADPSIEALRREGFPITTYAYPFGSRTGELDDALLARVTLLRSVSYTWSSIATDPCPH